MSNIPYSQLVKGTLLVASPDQEQGVFSRSVVLLCDHSSIGSFGLIINKSLDIELPDDILDPGETVNPHIQMRGGGPMQPNQMMLLHSSSDLGPQAINICHGVFLGGDLQFLQHASTLVNGPTLLLCFGYGGWGAGILEREFLDGYWFLHPATNKYIFETPPEKIWQTILRDMGGKYQALSMIPEDLSLN